MRFAIGTIFMGATFLTVNLPEIISNYTNVTAVNQDDGNVRALQSVITNCVTARTYGYADPDIQHITVRNDYVFLRNEFSQHEGFDVL